MPSTKTAKLYRNILDVNNLFCILEDMSLVGGIILLIIGIILYAIAGMLPPVATKIARILGIILAIIGVILIVLAALGVAFGMVLPL